MSQKVRISKRKLALSEPVEAKEVAQESDEDYESQVWKSISTKRNFQNGCNFFEIVCIPLESLQSDDGFFNVVNEEADDDSTDSEGDLEDSEEEDNFEDDEAESASDDEEEEDTDDEESEGEDDKVENSSSEVESETEQDVENGEGSSSSNNRLRKHKPPPVAQTRNGVKEIPKSAEAKGKHKNAKKEPKSSTSSDSGVDKATVDEYAEYDTSDEEDIRNTVGNIPKNWYDEYKHMGYDWDGKPIGKPESGDQLDNFLKRLDDPDFWKTVKDPQTGQDVVLSEDDIQVIQRLKAGKIPDVSFDEYAVSKHTLLVFSAKFE